MVTNYITYHHLFGGGENYDLDILVSQHHDYTYNNADVVGIYKRLFVLRWVDGYQTVWQYVGKKSDPNSIYQQYLNSTSTTTLPKVDPTENNSNHLSYKDYFA